MNRGVHSTRQFLSGGDSRPLCQIQTLWSRTGVCTSLKNASLTRSCSLCVPWPLRSLLASSDWVHVLFCVLTLTTIGKVGHLCHRLWTLEIHKSEPPAIINVIALPSTIPPSPTPADEWLPSSSKEMTAQGYSQEWAVTSKEKCNLSNLPVNTHG